MVKAGNVTSVFKSYKVMNMYWAWGGKWKRMIRCRPTILFVLARSKFSRTTETHWKRDLHAIMLLIIFIGCSHKKKTETKWVFYVNFNDRAGQRPAALDGFPPTPSPISSDIHSKRSPFPAARGLLWYVYNYNDTVCGAVYSAIWCLQCRGLGAYKKLFTYCTNHFSL